MVMYDGSKPATVSRMISGTATRTSPAPPRSAAMPAIATAPAIPRDPPTISARPKSPFWASGRRGGRRGNALSWDSIVQPKMTNAKIQMTKECQRSNVERTISLFGFRSSNKTGIS